MSFPGLFISEPSRDKASVYNNLLDAGDMTEALTGEKEKESRRGTVQQSRKSRFSTTRTRVIACSEQISDPLTPLWLIYSSWYASSDELSPSSSSTWAED